jgi:hypothetical protein
MRRLFALAVLFALGGAASNGYAAGQPDPAGTWKGSVEVGGQTYEFTLKLKTVGSKVTGVMVGADGKETPLLSGKFKDGILSTAVLRQEDGEKITAKSTATIAGNTMKGKARFELNGETQNLPWQAKRVVGEKTDPTGTWKASIKVEEQAFEYTLKLQHDGDQMIGTMVAADGGESSVQDASFKNGVLSLTVVYEEGLNKIAVKVTGTVSGDTIKGTASFELGGVPLNVPWEAKRAKN